MTFFSMLCMVCDRQLFITNRVLFQKPSLKSSFWKDMVQMLKEKWFIPLPAAADDAWQIGLQTQLNSEKLPDTSI